MSLKYELVSSDCITVKNAEPVTGISETIVFYRIRALRTFGDVKKGDLGGYISNDSYLSHEGNCWIYDKARVEDSKIYDDAIIKGKSYVQNSIISGVSIVKNSQLQKSVISRSTIKKSKINGSLIRDSTVIRSTLVNYSKKERIEIKQRCFIKKSLIINPVVIIGSKVYKSKIDIFEDMVPRIIEESFIDDFNLINTHKKFKRLTMNTNNSIKFCSFRYYNIYVLNITFDGAITTVVENYAGIKNIHDYLNHLNTLIYSADPELQSYESAFGIYAPIYFGHTKQIIHDLVIEKTILTELCQYFMNN